MSLLEVEKGRETQINMFEKCFVGIFAKDRQNVFVTRCRLDMTNVKCLKFISENKQKTRKKPIILKSIHVMLWLYWKLRYKLHPFPIVCKIQGFPLILHLRSILQELSLAARQYAKQVAQKTLASWQTINIKFKRYLIIKGRKKYVISFRKRFTWRYKRPGTTPGCMLTAISFLKICNNY